MTKLYKVRNLGPTPSDEELAAMIGEYMLRYGDYYEIKDECEMGQTPEDYVYDQSLNMVCMSPRDALTYVASELDECSDSPIDAQQIPMLMRLQDRIRAFIVVRGD